jgi:hypothetical protein
MSHTVSLDLQVKSLDSLTAACRILGLTFDRNRSSWRWYGRFLSDYNGNDAAFKHGVKPEEYGTADAGVITCPGAGYDVGVYKVGNTYRLVYDNWHGGMGLDEKLGVGLTRLKAQYGIEVAKRILSKQGYRCKPRIDKHGRPMIIASKAR